MKEVYIEVASHPTAGKAMILESVEATARDTNTKVEDWRVESGWVDIETARDLPFIAEALLAGRLKIREV